MASKLGPSRPLPNKRFPNAAFDIDSKRQLIISEKDKEKNDFELVKTIVNNYEDIGRRQINLNKANIIKMFNLAYGVIDKSDYIKDDTEYRSELELLGGEEIEYDLEFFPIVPNIVNTLSSIPSKTKIAYSAMAVNREAQNEILEHKNNQVRNLLVSRATEIFNANLYNQGVTPETQPDIYQQQLEIFQSLPKIQKYYTTDYRLTIEEWANHKLESDKRKHNILDLEKEALFNKIVADRPFIHINLTDGDYRPEVLKPDDCAWLKSPYLSDVGDGYMFMWYEHDSPINLIQRFGDKLSEEDAKKLESYFTTTRFTATTRENFHFENRHPVEAAVQNHLAFKTEFDNTSKHRGDEYRDTLIEVLNMYVQIPRKLYRLTMISDDGSAYSTIVDETYKVTFAPQYIKGKPKESINLIYGEHLDPFYMNEPWRVIKLNFSRNPNPSMSDDIWIVMEKYPLQLSNPRISHYGSGFPIHGGPTTNKYSSSKSVVSKCESWQIFYNYLWNRAKQLLQTELGTFFLLNQNAIPQESMGESWGKHNMAKFLLAARDTQLGPLDLSPTNIGGTNIGATGGFGQRVDLTRTDEVLQKVKLAEIIKNECLSQVGVSPQLLGDISPNETATGVLQGVSRSILALKNIYDEHFSMMEKVRQTMLECAKYVAITNGGTVEETYMNDEGERIIFQTDTENFPLYRLGVFVTSDFDDSLLLFEIKEMVKRDNTMGADALDKISMLSGNSTSEIFSTLQDLQKKREAREKAQQDQMAQLEQNKIDANERIKREQLDWEKTKLAAILDSEERIADKRTVGQAQLAQGGGVEELIKLEKQNLNERDHYQSILNRAKDRQLTQEGDYIKQQTFEDTQRYESNIEDRKLQVEREKNMVKLKVAEKQLEIAKENKP